MFLPDVCERTFKLAARYIEVLQVRHYLRDLREVGCFLRSLRNALADVFR